MLRPTGPWTPAVHALLRHLEERGFSGAPRVLGIDESEREILTYLHGEAALRPWPEALVEESGIAQVGKLLRAYHEAVATYAPSTEAVWRDPNAQWREGRIVRHGDLAPWNMIWKDGALVGFIDWDFAEPGETLDDLAQVAWYTVPLRSRELCKSAGIYSEVEQRSRLKTLCDSYGARPEAVLFRLLEFQENECERIRTLGEAGLSPWREFLERGDVERIQEDRTWLAHEFDAR